MNQVVKTVIFWLVILIAAMLLWQVVRSDRPNNQREPEISYSQFMADVEAGKVANVSITGTQINGHYRDGSRTFRLTGPSDSKIVIEMLQKNGIQFSFRDAMPPSGPLQALGNFAPILLLGALWFFMIRQMRRRSQGPPAPPSSNLPINPV